MSNSSIRPIHSTLLSTITPDQSEHRIDDNEGVLDIPQRIASPSDCLMSYQDTRWGGVFPLCRDAVCLFSAEWAGKLVVSE